MADPIPDAWLTPIHPAAEVAVHRHTSSVVTVTRSVVAGMHGSKATGATVNWQLPTSPCCRTMKLS